MTCDELRSEYLHFALGLLKEPEKSELSAHLARGCEACTSGIREARQLAHGIGASVEGPGPSRALRERILAAAGGASEPRWHWRTAWLTGAAVMASAAGVLLYQNHQQDRALSLLSDQLQRGQAETASLRAALDLLRAPETREVTFGPGAPARGRVFYGPSSVLLIAANLPAPPAGKTYEMWIIPKGGKPASAGLFASNQAGAALHFYNSAGPLPPGATVAVTLEIAAGVDAPTSQPVIAVAL